MIIIIIIIKIKELKQMKAKLEELKIEILRKRCRNETRGLGILREKNRIKNKSKKKKIK